MSQQSTDKPRSSYRRQSIMQCLAHSANAAAFNGISMMVQGLAYDSRPAFCLLRISRTRHRLPKISRVYEITSATYFGEKDKQTPTSSQPLTSRMDAPSGLPVTCRIHG